MKQFAWAAALGAMGWLVGELVGEYGLALSLALLAFIIGLVLGVLEQKIDRLWEAHKKLSDKVHGRD